MGLLPDVERTIRRHAMLAGGETVLVAVSGGADSVALLHVLHALAPSWRLRLHVLHVDHQLRPDSARDGEFVLDRARRLGIPAAVARVTVRAGASLEAEARAARYAALEAHADHVGADRIALGHTADDQAETVLMRLLEGAGVRGLAGIPAGRGRFIRPLLEVRRVAILAGLHEAGLPWREDPSNQDPKFLRNRIRHDLLPLLNAAYRPDVVTALNRVARLARSAVDAIDRLAATELARLALDADDAVMLPLAALRALPQAVAAEVLRRAAARFGRRAPLRAWGHRGLRRILGSPLPRRPFCLSGVRVEVSTGWVRLGAEPPRLLGEHRLSVPGRLPLPEIGQTIEARVVDAKGYEVPRGGKRVAFDADRLPAFLTVRGRRRGDRFAPFGGGERRLKRFLIGAKRPRWDRPRIPVVEAAGTILWLGGLRRGAAAPVTGATRRVLELVLRPLAS